MDNSSKTGLGFFVSMFLHSAVIALLALGPAYLPKLMNKNEPPSTTLEVTPIADASADMRTIVAKDSAPQEPSAPVTKPVEVKPEAQPVAALPEKIKTPKPAAKKFVAKTAPIKNAIKSNVLPQKIVDVTNEDEPTPEQEQVVAKEDSKKEVAPPTEDSDATEAAPVTAEDAKSGEKEQIADPEDAKTKASDDEFAAEKLADKQKKNKPEVTNEAIAAEAAAPAKSEKPVQAAAAATPAVANSAANGGGNGAASGHTAATQNYLGLRQMPGNQPPTYSRDMRLNQMQGQGQLVYFVSKDGSVSQVKVTKSTGHSELDQAAVGAFSKYHFVPGQEGYTVHDFEFSLKGPATNEPGHLRTSTQK